MRTPWLAEIFTDLVIQYNNEDLITPNHGYPHSWLMTPNDFRSRQKIFYSTGCSWMEEHYWSRTVEYHFPKYFHINRAVGGQSNFEIIQKLRYDIEYIEKLNLDAVFIVSLTEPVRCEWELRYLQPSGYKTATEYLKHLLEKEYLEITKILGNHQHYITTSFVPNHFNDNPTIMSYCEPFERQPDDCFHVQSGLYEWFKDRQTLFQFDLINDLDRVDIWRKFMQKHQFMADHYHPNHYIVYERLMESIENTIDLSV